MRSTRMRASTTASDHADRAAAGGPAEVRFITLLDAEVEEVNQFTTALASTIREDVAELEREVTDSPARIEEQRASLHRCSRQILRLNNFSNTCFRVFSNVLDKHDEVSSTPAGLRYSTKLSYQPFTTQKFLDLQQKLSAIDNILESRAQEQRQVSDRLAPTTSATTEEGNVRGLDAPLLGNKPLAVVEPTSLMDKITHPIRLLRDWRGGKGATGGTQQKVGKQKGARSLTPSKIEPKVYLANERTFLHWMHMCVTLGAVSMAMLAASDDDPGLAMPGLVLTTLTGEAPCPFPRRSPPLHFSNPRPLPGYQPSSSYMRSTSSSGERQRWSSRWITSTTGLGPQHLSCASSPRWSSWATKKSVSSWLTRGCGDAGAVEWHGSFGRPTIMPGTSANPHPVPRTLAHTLPSCHSGPVGSPRWCIALVVKTMPSQRAQSPTRLKVTLRLGVYTRVLDFRLASPAERCTRSIDRERRM